MFCEDLILISFVQDIKIILKMDRTLMTLILRIVTDFFDGTLMRLILRIGTDKKSLFIIRFRSV